MYVCDFIRELMSQLLLDSQKGLFPIPPLKQGTIAEDAELVTFIYLWPIYLEDKLKGRTGLFLPHSASQLGRERGRQKWGRAR